MKHSLRDDRGNPVQPAWPDDLRKFLSEAEYVGVREATESSRWRKAALGVTAALMFVGCSILIGACFYFGSSRLVAIGSFTLTFGVFGSCP